MKREREKNKKANLNNLYSSLTNTKVFHTELLAEFSDKDKAALMA